MKRAGVWPPVRFRPPLRRRVMQRAAIRFVRDEQAQDLIEYALLTGLLAVACIVGILQLTGIIDFFTAVGRALASAL